MKIDHIYHRYSIVTFGDTILTYPVLVNDKPSNVYVSDGWLLETNDKQLTLIPLEHVRIGLYYSYIDMSVNAVHMLVNHGILFLG